MSSMTDRRFGWSGALCAVVLAGCSAPSRPKPLSPEEPPTSVHRVVFPHADDPDRNVELYWTVPDGDGPWPAILYVHGHQSGEDKPGARLYADRGYLHSASERGLFAAAVSQPGYGDSDGPADYCGPRSQGAVATALAYLRAHPLVLERRIVLYGYSRGATTASMVAARETELCGVILGAGIYDLGARYADAGGGGLDAGLKANIRKEAGTSEDAFRARSALLADPPIRVPTLILHGERDEICSPAQAEQLADRLRAAGTPVTLVMFPDTGHGISSALSEAHENRFLAETAFASEGR